MQNIKLKISIHIVFIILVISSTPAQSQISISNIPDSSTLEQDLENIYMSKSDENMINFLDNWSKLSNPNNDSSNTEVQNEVYSIFKTIYNPYDMSNLHDHHLHQVGNHSPYKGVQYFLIQNTINYRVYETIDNSWYRRTEIINDTIKDFRPDVKFDNVKILYFFSNYKKAINQFLGPYIFDEVILKNDVIPKKNKTKRDRSSRLFFIRKYFVSLPRVVGSQYISETIPYISNIYLDKHYKKAIVEFCTSYSGGRSLWKKVGDNWIKIKSMDYWTQ